MNCMRLRIIQVCGQARTATTASSVLLKASLVASGIFMLAHLTLALAQPIERNPAQVRTFRAEHPCPATSRRSGACPGWHVDHIRPLCAGGEDRPANMQWIRADDHAFKTRVDVRECRKLKRGAGSQATE